MKKKKYIIDILLVIIFIICLGLSNSYYKLVNKEHHLATINIKNSEITNRQVNDMFLKEKDAKNPYDFVAWTETEKVTVNNTELKRQEEVNTLEICGNSSLLVDGPILFKDDKEGCLLDEDTAYSLFGSKNVKGLAVMINNNKYIVRGVHKGDKNLVVLQSKLTTSAKDENSIVQDNKLDYLSVNMKDERNSYVDSFCMKYGLNQEYVDNGVYSDISYFFMMLVPFVMITYLVIGAIKIVIKNRNKLILCGIIILSTIFLSIILLKIFGFRFKVNYDLIPNKWSDFNYWNEFFEKYSEKYRYMFYMKKSCSDRMIIDKLIKCVLFSLINLHVFKLIKKRIKIDKLKELIIYIFIILLIGFIVITKLNINLQVDKILIILLPIYILIAFLERRLLFVN